MPGPLDNLPRPLDERGRHGRGGRSTGRVVAILGLLAVVLVVLALIVLLATRPASAGDVLGAVGTAHPSATPDMVVATASPTATPTPTPTPTASTPAIGNVGPPDPATLTGYVWPLPHGRLTQPFGPSALESKMVDGQRFHDGIDLATFCGDRIVAAHDGVVLAAGRHYDRAMGWVGDLTAYFSRLDKKQLWGTLPIVIVIDDGNGYRSIYAHFSKVVVKTGATVKAGQLIGYEGATGKATGCHLHYGLFSPADDSTFGIDPAVVKRMKLPTGEIARIDPMLVLPKHR